MLMAQKLLYGKLLELQLDCLKNKHFPGDPGITGDL